MAFRPNAIVPALAIALTASSADDTQISGQYFFVEEAQPLRHKVPLDGSEDGVWNSRTFDDSTWAAGQLGIGFDPGTTFAPFINTSIETQMRGVNASAYIRIPFEAPNATFTSLTLQARYDDGFIAYLNGTEITRANAPNNADFQSRAAASHPDFIAVLYEQFDATPQLAALIPGATNVLAIHGMNTSITSSDFLIDVLFYGNAVPSPPPPPSPLAITSIDRIECGIRFAMPESYAGERIGLEYSPTLDAENWLDLGNFFDIDCVPTFIDPDSTRIGRASGYYRAFLRDPAP